MFEKKVRKQKRCPMVSLLSGLIFCRNQKYGLALAAFLVRCKICDGQMDRYTDGIFSFSKKSQKFF